VTANAVVVIGYGNELMSDDGVGPKAARGIRDDPRFAGVTVIQRHQLVPELAFDISTAAVVVFIDATTAAQPGRVDIEPVVPGHSGSSSHQVSPSTLVALARELYGRAAEGYVVSCGVQSVELGDHLTPLIDATVPKVIDAVAEIVTSFNAAGTPRSEPFEPRSSRR